MEETPAFSPTLAQSVYSIGTSKVTKDSEEDSDEEEENAEADGGSGKIEVAIDGMDILHSDGKHGAMLFETASMEDTSELASKGEGDMEEDSASSEKSESPRRKNGRKKRRRHPILLQR